MTTNGGSYEMGSIFKILANGSNFGVLHHFSGGGSDGACPQGSLVLSGAKLYGMTSMGNSVNTGAIFEIGTNGTGYNHIHSFSGVGGNDGAWPHGSLTPAGSRFYGLYGRRRLGRTMWLSNMACAVQRVRAIERRLPCLPGASLFSV